MKEDLLRAAQAANQQEAGLSLMRFQVALTAYAKIWEAWMKLNETKSNLFEFDDEGAADAAIQSADAFMARFLKRPAR